MSLEFNRRELVLLGAAALSVAAFPEQGAAQEPGKRRRALLVAVQGYDRPKDPKSASKLNTLPDITLLKQVLTTKLGFKAIDIAVLDTKADTTKGKIIAALKKFLMESETGDVLYFHYSGHGSQSINGDDYLGWDQTLVPSDYLTNSHANDIRDKDIARILKVGLEGKTPAAFLLSFDSCHSGTITRNGGRLNRSYTRDTPNMSPAKREALKEKRAQKQPGLLPAEAIAELKFTVFSACRSSEPDHETTDDNNRPIGSLSYALAKAMANAGQGATYRDLFERITDTMRAKEVDQAPVMEGLMDVGLLGGGVAPRAAYISIQYDGKQAELQAGKLMGLLPGSKLDIFPADTRDFEHTKPIGAATVIQSQALTALLDVKPLNGLTPETLKKRLSAARARVTLRVYTDKPMVVDLSLAKSHPRIGEIHTALRDLAANKLIILSETGSNWDVQLTPTSKAFAGDLTNVKPADRAFEWTASVDPKHSVIRGEAAARQFLGGTEARQIRLRGGDPSNPHSLSLLRNGDGSLLTVQIALGDDKPMYYQSLADSPQLPTAIAEGLRRESRRRLLTQLTGKASRDNAQIEIRIFLCNEEEDDVNSQGRPVYKWKSDIGELRPGTDGRFHAAAGSFFRVELRNRGYQPLYVSVLDLAPDGSIGPLWPHPMLNGRNLAAFDNSIKQGDDWFQLLDRRSGKALWQFTEPVGGETFMAIATPQQYNFAPLFDSQLSRSPAVARTREMSSPLGKLLRSATTRSTAASGGDDSVGDDWQAFSLHIDVQ